MQFSIRKSEMCVEGGGGGKENRELGVEKGVEWKDGEVELELGLGEKNSILYPCRKFPS